MVNIVISIRNIYIKNKKVGKFVPNMKNDITLKKKSGESGWGSISRNFPVGRRRIKLDAKRCVLFFIIEKI